MSPPDVLTISAARDTAALEVLEVEANPGESTFPGEILTCRAPDDGMVRLFRKSSAGAGHDCHGHRAGVAYEAAVYERLLAPIGMSTPAFYGAGVDGDGSWLLIEHLEGAERLDRTVSADGAIVRAAAWIGRFHAAAERLPAATRATLRRYDAEYYAGWLTESNHLGNVAFRAGKKLEWDPVSLKAKNCSDPDRIFIREWYQKPQLTVLQTKKTLTA